MSQSVNRFKGLPVALGGKLVLMSALSLLSACVVQERVYVPPRPAYAPPPPPAPAVEADVDVEVRATEPPPPLPDYEQPPCPEEGFLWTPGFWHWGPGGYYWVPGTWVAPPRVGVLWTPGYWGFVGGVYLFHAGYWGPHVGFYGGVNYGFGYGGAGFVGGRWDGGRFAYNTAVMHVDGRYIHSTYEDRAIVDRYTVARNNHVAFSGGPGGINHPPSAEERVAEHEQHQFKTSYQAQHEMAAHGDRTLYVKNNGGHPARLAETRPLAPAPYTSPGMQRPAQQAARPSEQPQSRPSQAGQPQSRPAQQSQQRPEPSQRPAPQAQQHPAPQQHPAQKPESKEEEKDRRDR